MRIVGYVNSEICEYGDNQRYVNSDICEWCELHSGTVVYIHYTKKLRILNSLNFFV